MESQDVCSVVVLSGHPVALRLLFDLLDSRAGAPYTVSEVPLDEVDSLGALPARVLFVIDACYLPAEISAVTRVLRVRYPGSKFLIIVPPAVPCPEGLVRLLHLGAQGVLRLVDDWQEKIVAAVDAVLQGKLWACQRSMAEFARQSNLLLEQQVHPDLALTARENQVMQLLIRRFSNKEIAGALRISERTVKFHVSNIFSKLKIESRRELLLSRRSAPRREPAGAGGQDLPQLFDFRLPEW